MVLEKNTKYFLNQRVKYENVYEKMNKQNLYG